MSNDLHQTALQIAVRQLLPQPRRGPHLIELLVAAGATSTNVETGWQGLFEASRMGHKETVQALLTSFDEEIDAQDFCGATPTMEASRMGHLDVLKVLVDNGADLDHKANDGSTPLMVAASEGHSEVVLYLLDGGARLNNTDRDGSTAMLWAARKGHRDTYRACLQAAGGGYSVAPFFSAAGAAQGVVALQKQVYEDAEVEQEMARAMARATATGQTLALLGGPPGCRSSTPMDRPVSGAGSRPSSPFQRRSASALQLSYTDFAKCSLPQIAGVPKKVHGKAVFDLLQNTSGDDEFTTMKRKLLDEFFGKPPKPPKPTKPWVCMICAVRTLANDFRTLLMYYRL